MSDLRGKTALVTGGSRGIGAAIARRLAENGADVAVTYVHNRDLAQGVVKDIESFGRMGYAVQADAADSAAVSGAVDTTVGALGRIDILVNNAGFMAVNPGPFEEQPLELVERTLDVNIRATVVASQAAARHMSPGGRIITIGSCLADRVPGPGMTLYSLSKAAMTGFTKGLARDLGARGITVNQINPGPIDTDMNPADGPAAEFQKGLTAVGRYGSPQDIASMAAYLAGPEAGFITGAAFAVDGGTNI
ncbi:SDR family oxidoreductase [Streptomyces sp. NBC_00237]|uniref:SDR family NAD(P)-dependent oxidoreductase n=1 Tax=Streptomyces sp. NBC_00237 TaxID=2975687 RepID=UPI0022543292|nr:SDR family oxidoreductase [Streptomyces sp. NBC_00237]MCX5206714.1 SDR family oxidoreductase [Streptomyces sp. NBC_00237]